MRAGVPQNIGTVCDLNETFASPGRPAYAHHCKCLGLRYLESAGSARPRGSEATRCLGVVKRRWTDTDEAALRELAEKERRASSQRNFDKLAPEVQERIKATYGKLQQASFRRDYPLVHELASQILQYVDDLGETRAIDAVAQKMLEPKAATLPMPPVSRESTGTATQE